KVLLSFVRFFIKFTLFSLSVTSLQCPPGWIAIGGSCYIVRRTGLTWSDALHRCSDLAAGSHLANLKSLEDLFFISSYLLSQNNLLLLWTGLNDQQVSYQTIYGATASSGSDRLFCRESVSLVCFWPTLHQKEETSG
uniref:C-type lectin domain-containing protein n=1 Tax=Maylandia zebra TaxID=106582 RepID=A0A3P9CYE8_9CICH